MRQGLCHFLTTGNQPAHDVENQATDDMDKDALEVSMTESWRERSQGLLTLPELEKHQGLWITPCNSVHTIGMSYSLDLIYLNRAYLIVKCVQQCLPRRISMCWSAKSVLEVPAGTIHRLNLSCGMQMLWQNRGL